MSELPHVPDKPIEVKPIKSKRPKPGKLYTIGMVIFIVMFIVIGLSLILHMNRTNDQILNCDKYCGIKYPDCIAMNSMIEGVERTGEGDIDWDDMDINNLSSGDVEQLYKDSDYV